MRRPHNAYPSPRRSDFNPRTPVGCDGPFDEEHELDVISIHAPQWGATGDARRGSRPCVISIHAPQWGATWRWWLPARRRPDFNPRTPVGCDIWHSRRVWIPVVFQSTHPSGVRLKNYAIGGAGYIISIHAPQWGATAVVGAGRAGDRISIHAPQWGATSSRGRGRPEEAISIHAPQWGATAVTPIVRRIRVISIHAPQWGATPPAKSATRPTRYFNPRTPVGCDMP